MAVGLSRISVPLSMLTLGGDTRNYDVVNPRVEGTTTSRGTPWTPSTTTPNNKNYFNTGPGVPDWLQWVTWGTGGLAAGKALRDNWPKPAIPPTTTNKTPQIAPSVPFNKW